MALCTKIKFVKYLGVCSSRVGNILSLNFNYQFLKNVIWNFWHDNHPHNFSQKVITKQIYQKKNCGFDIFANRFPLLFYYSRALCTYFKSIANFDLFSWNIPIKYKAKNFWRVLYWHLLVVMPICIGKCCVDDWGAFP